MISLITNNALLILEKALLADKPKEALRQLLDQGFLLKMIPELEPCLGFDQHHPKHHLDVWEHTLEVVNNTPPDRVLRWAALLHDIAKPITYSRDEEGTGHFYGHDRKSADMASDILKRLGYPEAIAERVSRLIYYHMVRLHFHTEKAVNKVRRKLGEEDTDKLVDLFQADQAAHIQHGNGGSVSAFELIYQRIKDPERVTEEMTHLESELEKLAAKWMELGEKKDPSQILFYNETVFPAVKTYFREKEAHKVSAETVDGLILTVGTSPEPLILSIHLLQPEKIIFLHTEETEDELDRIIAETGIKNSQWQKICVEETNLPQIYDACLKAWEMWGSDKKIFVDLTGGTKPMAAGLMAASAVLDLQAVSVSSTRYLREYRKPYPGSEYLEFLQNPYEVFGTMKRREARHLYRRYDFHGAAKVYQELCEKLPRPDWEESRFYLSRAYEELDGINVGEAAGWLEKIVETPNRYRACFSDTQFQKVHDQHKQLKLLAGYLNRKKPDALNLLQDQEMVFSLIAILYQVAERRDEQGQWDTASLLMYRILEMMEQRRLATYGMDTAKADYSNIPGWVTDNLLSAYNEKRKIPNFDKVLELPVEIGMAAGYLLLEVLEDPFRLSQIADESEKPEKVWKQFKNQSEKRNLSILAHGYQYVSQKDYASFRDMAWKLLILLSQVEEIDLAQWLAMMKAVEDE